MVRVKGIILLAQFASRLIKNKISGRAAPIF